MNVFYVKKSTDTDYNFFANIVDPDINLIKSGQGQHCLPSYTDSFNFVQL